MTATTRVYLELLADASRDAIVVTTMTAAKVWPLIRDRTTDVHYLPSAMGHAADIALGLALARPERRVLCVNGDGSLVMNLGGLITAAASGVRNLTHCVLVNGSYRIVGGAPIPGGRSTDWCGLARAAGWNVAVACETADDLSSHLPELFRVNSLAFASLIVDDPSDLVQRLPPRHPREALRALRHEFTGVTD